MSEEIKMFAKELCELLKKHKLGKFTGEIVSGFDHKPCYERYQFNWNEGRHGAEAEQMHITYEEKNTINIKMSNKS
jgi:hypothetical protein